MPFDIGFLELLVIFVIALVVLGPERMPKAMETLGRWIGKAKRSVTQFNQQVNRELEIEELKKQNYSLQQMFGVTGYPTIWFVNPVQKEGKKVNLDALGSMGYERGGPSNWSASAKKVIRK